MQQSIRFMSCMMLTFAFSSSSEAQLAHADLRVVEPMQLLRHAETAFTEMRSVFVDMSAHSEYAAFGSNYDNGLALLRCATTQCYGATDPSQEQASSRALRTLDRLYQQVDWETLVSVNPARTMTRYQNALGDIYRSAEYYRLADSTRFIAQGVFAPTYNLGASRSQLLRYAAGECHRRGWADAEAATEVACAFPAPDTIRCKGVFVCVE